MKKGDVRKVAAIHVTPETNSKSLRQVLCGAREKSREQIEKLESILESYDNQEELTPRALLCISFLMDWYTDGINDDLPGVVSSGLSRIIHRCAYETAKRYAERKELLEHSYQIAR